MLHSSGRFGDPLHPVFGYQNRVKRDRLASEPEVILLNSELAIRRVVDQF